MPGDHFIKHPDGGPGQLQLGPQLGVGIRRGRVPGRNRGEFEPSIDDLG